MRAMHLALVLSLAACGVSKDYVTQQTTTTFSNTGSVARHLKELCDGNTTHEEDCKQSATKLQAICESLSELSKQAGGKGYVCAEWRVAP